MHHTPTASLRRLLDAAVAGIEHPDLEGAATARPREALEADVEDVAAVAGVVLLTPVNLGYISGALKHFFDSTYRDIRARELRLPFVAVVKGTTDATGALRAIEQITTGLGWTASQPPVVQEGDVDDAFAAAVTEAAGQLTATALL